MNQNTFVANYLKQFNDPVRFISVLVVFILIFVLYFGITIKSSVLQLLDDVRWLRMFLQDNAPAQTYQDFSEQVFPGQGFPEIETYYE